MSSTLNEYVCQDCGCLLLHSNQNTLESMKDVHKQLCIVTRQKSTAAQAVPATPKQAASVQKPSVTTSIATAPSPPAVAGTWLLPHLRQVPVVVVAVVAIIQLFLLLELVPIIQRLMVLFIKISSQRGR